MNRRKWTTEENRLLIENYGNKIKLLTLINRNYDAILQHARKIGLKPKRTIWTEEENIYLIKNYYDENMKILILKLNKSSDAIKIHARKLNLYRSNDIFRESNLIILLNNSNESYYWFGFILADGHINLKSKRLHITLSIKDESHLYKFARYINCNNIRYGKSAYSIKDRIYENISITAQNIDIIPKISKILGIYNSNKTKNPPNISNYNINDDQLLSLILGFFDGDGSVSKRHYSNGVLGKVQCHSSWLNNIKFMKTSICRIFNIQSIQDPHINKRGYTWWDISSGMLNAMKNKAIELNLPIMERKWDKVTVFKKIVLTDELINYITNSNKSTELLSKELDIKYSTIYNFRIRHGLPIIY